MSKPSGCMACTISHSYSSVTTVIYNSHGPVMHEIIIVSYNSYYGEIYRTYIILYYIIHVVHALHTVHTVCVHMTKLFHFSCLRNDEK